MVLPIPIPALTTISEGAALTGALGHHLETNVKEKQSLVRGRAALDEATVKQIDALKPQFLARVTRPRGILAELSVAAAPEMVAISEPPRSAPGKRRAKPFEYKL